MSKSPKFVAHNVEDITKKPAPVQALWKLLSQMDPDGDLWVNDKGIIALAGQTADEAKDRTPKALKLSPDEINWITNFAVYDSPEPDNGEHATGLLFTMYQLAELAFSLGTQWEAARITKAVVKAADGNGEEDEDEDEDFDEEEDAEDMEEVVDPETDDDDDDEQD